MWYSQTRSYHRATKCDVLKSVLPAHVVHQLSISHHGESDSHMSRDLHILGTSPPSGLLISLAGVLWELSFR